MGRRKRNKPQPKPIVQETIKNIVADTTDFVLTQKTEMMIKDYETAFQVYGREETIVYNFRSWTITLVSAYLGFLLTKTTAIEFRDTIPGIIVITIFYILEVSERSVMRRIVEDVRAIENVFMITNEQQLKKEILLYKFRDIRDDERNFFIDIWDFIKSLFAMQVFWWFIFMATTYIVSLAFISHINFISIFQKSFIC